MTRPTPRQPTLAWPGRDARCAGPGAGAPPPALHGLEFHAARRPPLLAGVGAPGAAPPGPAWCNRLCLGDNLDVMRALAPELAGRVQLVYIDPPFGSGDRFFLRAAPSAQPRPAYADAWSGGLAGYLEMLEPRLRLIRELLAPDGSLYVHLDPGAAHYVKVLLDEIFGIECFQREIVWRIGWVSGYKAGVRNWVRNHDTILFYTKDPRTFPFHKVYVPHRPGYRRRGGGAGPGHPVDDVWNGSPAEHALTGSESLDSIQVKSFSPEKTGYETQKNESLLRRIIGASSSPGDLVADFFAGSGTAAVVAERLGRRWVACDASPAAVHVARKRLLGIEDREAFAVMTTAEGATGAGWGQAGTPEGAPGCAAHGVAAGDGEMPALACDVQGRRLTLRACDPAAVDYLAAQWEATGSVLQPDAVVYRTYRDREAAAPLQLAHTYPAPGERVVAAHVADAQGRLRAWRRRVAIP